MNTVFIIAHAPLASALRAGALHVFPDAGDAVLALDIAPSDPPEDSLAAACALLATAPAARRVLLLTDVLGATPSNVAQRLAASATTGTAHEAAPLPLLAGVNLPMLLRALCYRAEPLAAMTERALAGGAQGIVRVAAAPTP